MRPIPTPCTSRLSRLGPKGVDVPSGSFYDAECAIDSLKGSPGGTRGGGPGGTRGGGPGGTRGGGPGGTRGGGADAPAKDLGGPPGTFFGTRGATDSARSGPQARHASAGSGGPTTWMP